MNTSTKSQSEIAKLNKYRQQSGQFGNRDFAEADVNLNGGLPELTQDEIYNPWGVEIPEEPATLEATQETPAEETISEPAPVTTKKSRITAKAKPAAKPKDNRAFSEAAGMTMHDAIAESAPLKSSEEVVLGALFRDPDKSVDAFCKANPGLPPGKARALLHEFTNFLERNIDAPNWKTSLQDRIDDAREPIHESFVMRPDINDVNKAAHEVGFAAEMNERYGAGQANDKYDRLNFHNHVPHLTVEQAEEAFDAALNLKNIDHEDWRKPVEDAVRKNAEAAGHKFDYNYAPPGAVATTGYGPNPHQGSLYSGWRSVTEINKDARAELTRAQKAGYIPRSLKFNVRGEKFSGGQAMRVSVKGTDMATRIDQKHEHGRRSELASELDSRIDSIINAWNHTDNDAMTDYYSTNYYTSINYYDNED